VDPWYCVPWFDRKNVKNTFLCLLCNEIVSGIASLLSIEENRLFSKRDRNLALIGMMDYNVVKDDSDAVIVIAVVAAVAWINSCMDRSMACCSKVMPRDTTFFFQPKCGRSKARRVV